jgi:hypothetical protein
MPDILIGTDKYEVSSANGRWQSCDLDNGFLVLISDVVSRDYITQVLVESDFQAHEYNKVFKSQPNRAWCLRFMIDKSDESKVQTLLDKFNV